MKKTHWLRNTLIILLVCAIAGSILSVIQFRKEQNRTGVTATLTFSFDGAQEGLAPNGYAFNPSEMDSGTVISDALQNAGLAEKYTVEEIQRNLSVQGNYPENLLERLGSYDSVTSGNAGTNLTLTSYHPTVFTVRLYNDFDPKLGQTGLAALLENLIDAYKARFARTGTWAAVTFLTEEDLSTYDYFQQLDMLQLRLEQIRDYAAQLAEEEPTIRQNGRGFSDWSAQLDGLINGDLARASAIATTNALSKDVNRLEQQYLFMINQLSNQAVSETARLDKLNELISTFAKTGIIYLSTNETVNRVDNVSSRYYDRLSDQRNEVSENIASLNAQITNYKNRLKELTGATVETALTVAEEAENGDPAVSTSEAVTAETDATAAETEDTPLSTMDTDKAVASLERVLKRVVIRGTTLTGNLNNLIDAVNEQDLGPTGILVSGLRYKAPSLISGEFAKQLLQTAGPLCALGLMAALVCLIVSRRKEEKRVA